jgi:hypothetical protein
VHKLEQAEVEQLTCDCALKKATLRSAMYDDAAVRMLTTGCRRHMLLIQALYSISSGVTYASKTGD